MAKPDAGELEPSIDALYQAPLDRFTAERNALAVTLKKAGDKAAAERVKSLTKPSTTAWAINQVWWKHRDRFEAMLEAGAAQRKAHLALAQGRKADLRSADDARRDAVTAVAEAAFDVLGGRHRVAPDVQYRITGTLEALASSGVPEGEAPGRLTGDLQSSGLDALAALAGAAGAAPRPTLVARGTPAARRHSADPARTAPAASGHERPAADEQSARERKAREAADAAARARAAEAAAAEAQLAELSTALEAAARAVAETASIEAEARRALDQAAARRKELESALDEARAAEAAARRELSSATAAASRAAMDRGRAAKDVARAREAVDRLTR